MVGTKTLVAMGAVLIVAATALVYAISLAGDQPPRDGDMIGFDMSGGGPAPRVPFHGANGAPVSLDDFAGQVVLVNFWATWCAPCVHEMPSLDRLQQDLGGDDFQVVAISVDQGGEDQVRRFFQSQGLSDLEVYTDPSGRVAAAFGTPGLPTTVVIGRYGSWLGTLVGPADWAGPDARALLRHFLDRPV